MAERQLIISEKSKPDDIKAWLKNGRDVVIVVADEVTKNLRKCVRLARGFKVPIKCPNARVEEELLTTPPQAARRPR